MGGKPETVYSDDEGALNSKEIQAYFNENKINISYHVVTRQLLKYPYELLKI